MKNCPVVGRPKPSRVSILHDLSPWRLQIDFLFVFQTLPVPCGPGNREMEWGLQSPMHGNEHNLTPGDRTL